MYLIWKSVHTNFGNHKTYIGKTRSQKKAEWIYDGLVGESSVALSYKYDDKGDDVWYGYEYVPDHVPAVKSAKNFTKKYIDSFSEKAHREIEHIHRQHSVLKRLSNLHCLYRWYAHVSKQKDNGSATYYAKVAKQLNQDIASVSFDEPMSKVGRKMVLDYRAGDSEDREEALHSAKVFAKQRRQERLAKSY